MVGGERVDKLKSLWKNFEKTKKIKNFSTWLVGNEKEEIILKNQD